MNRSIGSAAAAVESFYKLADVVPKEKWEGQISHLLNLLKTGNDTTSWNGAYALASLAPKMDDKFLQEQIGKILNIARSHTGFRKTHAVSCLGKLYHYADSREEILDTLLSSARDSSENMRRAAIFALEGCISDETKDRIFSCFEDLLEDEANMVKYGALEALTEVLPYRISDKALDRILGFLKADEQWVRWRVALALGKAYPKLDAKQREKAVSTLTELIRDKDIFVKVRAYEALLNIKKSAKREFPKVDKALKSEPDFVQHWVLYNSDLG
jgi:HEAT repeat protein